MKRHLVYLSMFLMSVLFVACGNGKRRVCLPRPQVGVHMKFLL